MAARMNPKTNAATMRAPSFHSKKSLNSIRGM